MRREAKSFLSLQIFSGCSHSQHLALDCERLLTGVARVVAVNSPGGKGRKKQAKEK